MLQKALGSARAPSREPDGLLPFHPKTLLGERELLAAVPIAVLIADSNGTCIDINPAALDLLRVDYEAAVGASISALLGQEIDLKIRSKPKDADNLTVDILRVLPANAQELVVEFSASLLKSHDESAIVYFLRDITDEVALEQQLRETALKDPLTGLPNRYAIETSIDLALQHIARGAPPAVLCFLDLDNFKEVNDCCGHAAGDALLKLIADLIKERVRATDAIGRVGGDEFVALLNGCALGDARDFVERLRSTLSSLDFNWNDRSFKLSMSAGLTLLTPATQSTAIALSEADIACLEAKSTGRGKTCVFSGPHRYASTNFNAEADLLDTVKVALASGAISLSQQPLRDMHVPGRGNLVSEILLRMKDADGQLIPPTQLVRSASRYGLASALDRLIIRRVLDFLMSTDPSRRRRRLYVNITTSSILDASFASWLEDNVPAAIAPFIGIEIKESILLLHPEPARGLVAAARAIGCGVAVDHVSGAVEALSHILSLPVSLLKLSPAFSKMTAAGDITYIQADALVQIAHQASLPVAITNIETRDALRCVRQLRADFAQGVAISPARALIAATPVKADDIIRLQKASDRVRPVAANA